MIEVEEVYNSNKDAVKSTRSFISTAKFKAIFLISCSVLVLLVGMIVYMLINFGPDKVVLSDTPLIPVKVVGVEVSKTYSKVNLKSVNGVAFELEGFKYTTELSPYVKEFILLEVYDLYKNGKGCGKEIRPARLESGEVKVISYEEAIDYMDSPSRAIKDK